MSKHRRRQKRKKPLFHKRSAPGAAPGMIVALPEAPVPEIEIIQYGVDQFLEEKVTNLDELSERLGKQAVTWVAVNGLGNAKTIGRLGQIFGLHVLALEDVVNVHQRPKIEKYDDHLFVVARVLGHAGDLESKQISVFVGKNFVLTFQEHSDDFFEPVRKRLRKNKGRIRKAGADYLLYALLDSVIDAYFPVTEEIGDQIDLLDEHITSDNFNNPVREIHKIRSNLLMLRKINWGMREVVNSLMRDDFDLIGDEIRIYLRDSYDHTMQIIDAVESCRELASDLRDFYQTQLANRTNDIMKVLTIIATIFIPLGFIAGVYGMNFNPKISDWNMPELNWVYGYPFALVLMIGVASSLLVFFWYRGWLRK